MTCAGITDCLLAHVTGYPEIRIFFAITDVALTSSIGLGFGIIALVDMKILSEKNILTKLLFVAEIPVFWYLWYESLVVDPNPFAFNLYKIPILIGCGGWVVL